VPELSHPKVETAIRAAQERWMEAWRIGDRATLERLLAPEFALVVSAHPTAHVDRAMWLKTALNGYSCESFRYDKMQVRDFGDLVVVSSLATQRATALGKDRSGTFFLTDVWRPGLDGEWQVIARYSSHPEPSTASADALHEASVKSSPTQIPP
jgi:ketosteroid isomerase-like protein